MPFIPVTTIQPAVTPAKSNLAASGLTRSNATTSRNSSNTAILQWYIAANAPSTSAWRLTP